MKGTIEFLEATSKFVKNFNDSRPVKSSDDTRLKSNMESLKWFEDWESSVTCDDSLTNSEKLKMLMSIETRDDMRSMVLGVDSFVKRKLEVCPEGFVVLARTNSDVVENIFCSHRGLCNGSNTNPTYQQYRKDTNTILLTTGSQSRKSNAYAGDNYMSTARPYSHHVGTPVRSRPSKSIRI